ncbi:hypothetical protein ACHAWF_010570 [Thalassiosira exigua]
MSAGDADEGGSGDFDAAANETHAADPPAASPAVEDVDAAEEEHRFDADAALGAEHHADRAYYVNKKRLYFLPESAVAMLVGVVIGGVTQSTVRDLTLFSFSPEFFFFVLLPPIIFEAGYSLEKRRFFDNIGAIVLFAFVGTLLSTMVIGGLTLGAARIGLLKNVDKSNPMEALLFGALISAVDPVATLSIMGSPELECNSLLYSLVFGESVLNDAVAIVLFRTFRTYYNPDGPDLSQSAIPAALLSFSEYDDLMTGRYCSSELTNVINNFFALSTPATMTLFSICVGVGWNQPSYIYFATAAMQLHHGSFLPCNGFVPLQLLQSIQHSANNDRAILCNPLLHNGDDCFPIHGHGRFYRKIQELGCCVFCAGNLILRHSEGSEYISHISCFANCCRSRGENKITCKMQCVLWFAGLRGAIAFALSMNMPGPNSESYATTTLFICMFKTIVCGGFTERILTQFGMKRGANDNDNEEGGFLGGDGLIVVESPLVRRMGESISDKSKEIWNDFDNNYMKELFGGAQRSPAGGSSRRAGSYELGAQDEENEY